MVQRVVSCLFPSSGDSAPFKNGSDFRFPADKLGQGAQAFGLPPDAVPPVQFTQMPEQDLAIWTFAGLLTALVREMAGALRPAELRAISIRDNDHA